MIDSRLLCAGDDGVFFHGRDTHFGDRGSCVVGVITVFLREGDVTTWKPRGAKNARVKDNGCLVGTCLDDGG
jgi:hypothetical protein